MWSKRRARSIFPCTAAPTGRGEAHLCVMTPALSCTSQHLGAAEHTGVIRLPAALGIKRRAVEHDGEAVLDRLAREHPRVKLRQKGVGIV